MNHLFLFDIAPEIDEKMFAIKSNFVYISLDHATCARTTTQTRPPLDPYRSLDVSEPFTAKRILEHFHSSCTFGFKSPKQQIDAEVGKSSTNLH